MTVAQGSRSQLIYKQQADFETPAADNYDTLPYTTHSLSLQKETVESATNHADREIRDLRHGASRVGGQISSELVYSDHDLLLSSALFNTWSTGELQIGTGPQFMSIEDGALDASKFALFTGLVVSQAQISIQPNAIVTLQSDVVGRAQALADTTAGGTPTAESGNEPFASFQATVFEDIAEANPIAIATGIDITINNSAEARNVIGSNLPNHISFGMGRVTGSLTVLFEDFTFVQRFADETTMAIVVNLTDPAGNVMELRMPRVKLTTGETGVQNPQDRVVTASFAALRDPTLGTALKITKTDAV